MRKQDNVDKALIILFAGFLFWFIASFWEINAHSLESGYKYSKYNLINIIFTPAHASEYTARHEAKKGIARAEYLENLDLLARVINAEGGGADYVSDDMCYAIGSVVLNRVHSDRFPNSIKEVIFAHGQYDCVRTGTFYMEPNERSVQIADELLNGSSVLPESVVFQAEFTQGSGIYIKIQNMYFCYE